MYLVLVAFNKIIRKLHIKCHHTGLHVPGSVDWQATIGKDTRRAELHSCLSKDKTIRCVIRCVNIMVEGETESIENSVAVYFLECELNHCWLDIK